MELNQCVCGNRFMLRVELLIDANQTLTFAPRSYIDPIVLMRVSCDRCGRQTREYERPEWAANAWNREDVFGLEGGA